MGYRGVIVGMTGDPPGCDAQVAFLAAGLTASCDKTRSGTMFVKDLLRALADTGELDEGVARELAAARQLAEPDGVIIGPGRSADGTREPPTP